MMTDTGRYIHMDQYMYQREGKGGAAIICRTSIVTRKQYVYCTDYGVEYHSYCTIRMICIISTPVIFASYHVMCSYLSNERRRCSRLNDIFPLFFCST